LAQIFTINRQYFFQLNALLSMHMHNTNITYTNFTAIFFREPSSASCSNDPDRFTRKSCHSR